MYTARHGNVFASCCEQNILLFNTKEREQSLAQHRTANGNFSGEYQSDRRPTRSLALLPPPPSSGSFFIVTFLLKSAAFQTVRQTFPPSPHIWLSSVCPSVPKSPFNFSQAAYLRFFATIVWAARCSCLAGFGCCPPHHNSHNRE